jgi:hypothetical protein
MQERTEGTDFPEEADADKFGGHGKRLPWLPLREARHSLATAIQVVDCGVTTKLPVIS